MSPSLGCFRVSLCVCCLLSVHELVTLGPYPHHSPSLSPTSVLQGLATGMVWEPGSSLRPTCSQVPGGAGVGWGALDSGVLLSLTFSFLQSSLGPMALEMVSLGESAGDGGRGIQGLGGITGISCRVQGGSASLPQGSSSRP